MARPLGDISDAILARLERDGPLTMRELATLERVHIRSMWWTMDRLVSSGRVVVQDLASVPWARRPVARYAVPACPASVVSPFSAFHEMARCD